MADTHLNYMAGGVQYHVSVSAGRVSLRVHDPSVHASSASNTDLPVSEWKRIVTFVDVVLETQEIEDAEAGPEQPL